MSKKTRSMALVLIIMAGVMGIGYIWMIYGSTPNASEAPELSKKINGKILLDGTVVAEKNADLGFIIPAKITTISKKVGDSVRSGELLAVQDSVDLRAQLDAAEANAGAASSQLEMFKHDLKKEKLKVHDVSGRVKKEQQAQVASSQDSVSAQESVLAAAQAGVTAAQAQLNKTLLKAPFDGIIIRQDAEIGEISGATVPAFMTISSTEPLKKIEAFASDLDVANIKIGDSGKVTFDFLGSQKTIDAKVVTIDPSTSLNGNNSAYKVTLMLENTDEKIRSGMHASVSF